VERQIEARVRAAYQEGQIAGEQSSRQNAMQRATQHLEPAIAGLNAVIAEVAATRKRFRTEAEEDTVKLAVGIARRVLRRELSTDPDAILGLVKAAFQKLNARETHRLRVSKVEEDTVREHRGWLDLPPGVEIIGDASLPAGSAVFETSRGELDASVDTQLSEIERGFTDIIRRRAK
jgi:flagellar assembly protein FliH